MIGKISGRVDYRGSDHVLLDVRGVGYIVHVSDRTMANALDEMFQGGVAVQDEGGTTDKQEQFDRDMQRREALMPRYAELIRMLGASPGQKNTDDSG